jgi:hypothetical protein
MPCGKIAAKLPAPPAIARRSRPLAPYRLLQKKHEAILANYQPTAIRTTLIMNAAPIWTRIRIDADSRKAAETLCSRLRAAGETCLVQRN